MTATTLQNENEERVEKLGRGHELGKVWEAE